MKWEQLWSQVRFQYSQQYIAVRSNIGAGATDTDTKHKICKAVKKHHDVEYFDIEHN